MGIRTGTISTPATATAINSARRTGTAHGARNLGIGLGALAASIGVLVAWPGALTTLAAGGARTGAVVTSVSLLLGMVSFAVFVVARTMHALHCRRHALAVAGTASAFAVRREDVMLSRWRAGLAVWALMVHVCCWVWFMGAVVLSHALA